MYKRSHYCEKCGNAARVYPIVKVKGIINAPINNINLCSKHKDIEEKDILQLQKKLLKSFINKHYHKNQIADILEIKHKDVDELVKELKWSTRGYKGLDIVKICMGGALYDDK